MWIVGIDCASDAKRIGVARAEVGSTEPVLVRESAHGLSYVALRELLGSWVQGGGATLLAIDAPLGWPDALRAGLGTHVAGERLKGPADHLFLRQTDHAIWKRLGKRPLEVGADRIARAARTALALMGDLRQDLGLELPLAWQGAIPAFPAVIEVYPAATLVVHGLGRPSYKRKEQRPARAAILHQLAGVLELGSQAHAAEAVADVLDAALCTLAGADFVRGRCVAPPEAAAVRGEGWIWA